jgi:hypothetical protein
MNLTVNGKVWAIAWIEVGGYWEARCGHRVLETYTIEELCYLLPRTYVATEN